MNKEEYMMTAVSEEAGEITQAISKLLRFGKNNFHPNKPDESNEDALLKEFYQLQGMVEHLQQQGMLKTLQEEKIESIKREKLKMLYKYMEESKAKGTLNLNQEVALETIQNDAYFLSCRCPKCKNRTARGYDERTFYCERCGTKLHRRAFTDKEIDDARFQHEMDDYED